MRLLRPVLAFAALLAAIPAHAQDGAPKDPPEHISNSKLNAYIKGYNTLLSTFGLQAEYHLYVGQQIARKGVNDPVMVSDGWLDNAVDEFKQARAIPKGGLPDVDEAGDQIIPVLDRLVGRLKGLDAYYESRGQLEDNFARGKREDPLVIADFKEALADMDQLNTALDVAIAHRDEATLADLKASGDMVGYDGGLALQKSKLLIDLFNSEKDMHDPAVLQRADALVTIIEAALADERKQLDAVKTSGDDDNAIRNSGYGIAGERLQGLIGAYRDMKRTGQPFQHQMMVAAYNNAVDSANIGQ